MIRFGYVYPSEKLLRTPQWKLSEEKVEEEGRENLLRVADALEWNAQHGIRLFTIPSETIPLSPKDGVMRSWKKGLDIEGQVVGDFIRKNRMRIFMHTNHCPGSPDPANLRRAMREIEHYSSLMDLLGLNSHAKIITNIGRIDRRRKDTARRFMSSFRKLSPRTRKRVVVENDELHWSFYDAFGVAGKLNIPIVLNYQAFLRNMFTELSLRDTLKIAAMSWEKDDGRQKIQYSEKKKGKKRKPGLAKRPFLDFYRQVEGLRVDVVLNSREGRRTVLKANDLIR